MDPFCSYWWLLAINADHLLSLQSKCCRKSVWKRAGMRIIYLETQQNIWMSHNERSFLLVPKEKNQLPFLTNVLSRQQITKPNCMQNNLRKICCKSLQELLQMWVGGRMIKQDKTNKESSAKSLRATTETYPKFNSEFMKYEATVWTPTARNIPFISSLVLKKQIKKIS